MKKFNFVWLLIVPAIVLTFNFFFVKNEGKFFMDRTDPTYCYLFNGLNLANGKMEIGHVDHPGTTVQITTAVFIKIIHAVAGKNSDLATDVLTDPERYLNALSFIFLFLSAILLFYSGYVIKRVSNNIALAVFMQAGILASYISLICMTEIRTESFIIFGDFLLVAICFSFIHEKEISPRRMYGYSLKFALICAFLIVTKMTCLPLIILPLFLLRKWKSWLLYIPALVVFTVLFLIPALSKMGYMFNWAGRLLTHSGIYGSGEAKIVDFAVFKESLWYMFRDDIPFAISCLLLFFAFVISIFRGKFKFHLWKEDVLLRSLTGIFLVTLASILIVAKHFKYHYLIPVDGLMMLGAYVSIRLLFPPASKLIQQLKNNKIQIAGVFLFVILYSFIDFDRFTFNKNLENPKVETARVMEKYKDVPRLYMTYEYYFAEDPPALFFGSCYAGATRFDYYKKLRKIYPKAYFYSIIDNEFHQWGATFELDDLVNNNKQILVSFYITDTTIIRKSLDVLRELNSTNKVIELKKIYVNPISGEQLYELNRIQKIKEVPDSAQVITCDVENILRDSLMSTTGNFFFQGGEARTDKEKHSGKAALELTNIHQYGFSIDISVKAARHFEITAWRKNENGRGILVATGANGKFYKPSSSVAEEGENGWEKIRMKFELPADYSDSTVEVFAWNEGENEIVYFDDFTITQY